MGTSKDYVHRQGRRGKKIYKNLIKLNKQKKAVNNTDIKVLLTASSYAGMKGDFIMSHKKNSNRNDSQNGNSTHSDSNGSDNKENN